MVVNLLNTIIGALVGVLGTYLINRIEILNRVNRRISDGLIGQWDVKWYEYSNYDFKNEDLLVEDSILIKKIRNNKFEVKVDNPRIKYSICGSIDINTMTYEFHGIDKLGVNGTGVLSIGLNRNRMSGLWIQSAEDEKYIIGRCVWEKRKI